MKKNTLQMYVDAKLAACKAEALRDGVRRCLDGTAKTKMSLQDYADFAKWAEKEYKK